MCLRCRPAWLRCSSRRSCRNSSDHRRGLRSCLRTPRGLQDRRMSRHCTAASPRIESRKRRSCEGRSRDSRTLRCMQPSRRCRRLRTYLRRTEASRRCSARRTIHSFRGSTPEGRTRPGTHSRLGGCTSRLGWRRHRPCRPRLGMQAWPSRTPRVEAHMQRMKGGRSRQLRRASHLSQYHPRPENRQELVAGASAA